MAELDLSPPCAPVDLPELPLELGLGDRPAVEHFGLAGTTAHRIEMEDGMKLLLLGPKDEKCLPPIFGLIDHEIHKLEDKSNNLIIGDDAIAVKQTHSNNEIDDYIVEPSLLDFLLPRGGEHGQRKCRKRSTSWKTDISHLFGLQKPFASEPTKYGRRKKNNVHWTSLEAKKLVQGVSKYGVGNWTKVKKDYFKPSIRKPTHLKDKWRDLLRACGIQVGSKKMVQAQKATLRIIKGLKHEIISLHRKHVAQERRRSRR